VETEKRVCLTDSVIRNDNNNNTVTTIFVVSIFFTIAQTLLFTPKPSSIPLSPTQQQQEE
jgi:hypothetical protein